MPEKCLRLNRAKAGLLVIDIQEKLLPLIFEKDRLVQNCVRLIKAAQILGLPVFVTEQYRKGLGPTDQTVAAAVADFAPIEKVTFSSCGAEGLLPAMNDRGLTNLILCGIEAHVCVLQTCLDLLEENRSVFVVADAISSRDPENRRIALERMRSAGAEIVTVEMALFEMLGRAATDEFKQILALLR